MEKARYNWKRFWYPRGRAASFLSDAFLPDPEHDFLRHFSPEARLLSDLTDVPCLILLGEGGVGKSFEIDLELRRLNNALDPAKDIALCLDLGDFEASGLVPGVFRHPKVEAWRHGEHNLHLWLDSFDDAAIESQRLARVIARELRDIPPRDLQRLFLRVGCRDKDWPELLEDALRGLWSDSEGGHSTRVQAHCLAPLRERDVEVAAAHCGLNAAEFIRSIRDKDLSVFANRPLTLELLLAYPRQRQAIPDSREQIFREGCLRLCDETKDLRRSFMRLTDEERLGVVARIAAMMLFSGKTAASLASGTGACASPDVLPISDIVDHPGSEVLGRRPVTKAHVEEAMGTALFSHQGSGRVRWSHNSYAEFLAAWYVKTNDVDADRAMRLMVHPRGPGERLVPQLREVAAWLATMVDGVFDRLLDVDPEVLAASDLHPADSAQRQRLASTVLRMVETGDLNTTEWHLQHYRRLAHPDIAAQLRPYLSDAQEFRLRNEALWIAAACTPADLRDDLFAMATSASEDYDVRWRAVWALGHYQDAGTIARLRPLALTCEERYPDDQLQAHALHALWPSHATTEEILTGLGGTVPDQFLSRLEDVLSVEDLPMVLSWLERHDTEGQSGSREFFADRVLLRALECLDRIEVRKPLARFLVRLLRRDNGILRSRREEAETPVADPTGRRLLLEEIVPLLDDPSRDAWRVCGSSPPLVVPDDVPWLVDRFGLASSSSDRTAIAGLIDHLVAFYPNPAGYTALLAAFETGALPELRDLLRHEITRSCSLSSRSIRQAQYYSYRRQVWQRRTEARRSARVPPSEQIPRLLAQISDGYLWAYEELTRAIGYDRAGTSDFWALDITRSPGWMGSSATVQAQVVLASREFATEYRPPPDSRPSPDSVFYWEIAGCKALRLLIERDPDSVTFQNPDRWQLWAPVVICYPAGDESDEKALRRLASSAYRHAPGVTLAALRSALRQRRSRPYLDLSPIRRLQDVWDGRLTQAALEESDAADFEAGPLQQLLSLLFDLDPEPTRSFAESLLLLPGRTDDRLRSRRAAASAALLNHAREGDWILLRPVLFEDAAFGLDVVTRALPPYHDDPPPFVQLLDPEELTDLYIWLHEQAPVESRPLDPIPKAKRFITAAIASADPIIACRQLERMATRFPGEKWRRSQVTDAWETALARTWQPPEPADVLDLVVHSERRLVRGGRELLDAVLFSLTRLQVQLRDEAMAEHLWNDDPRKPKDEKAFAREVARHLRRDLSPKGIVVGCEVEIREGQRTDIHVTAVVNDASFPGYANEQVIVEVKGSWYREIYAAINNQLVQRYMNQNGCAYGVYLVGCFNCDDWTDSDPDKRVSMGRPSAKLESRLSSKAQELCVDGRIVRAFVLDVGLYS